MNTSLTKRIARQVAAVASLGALFACTSPPFNDYDPPPTFAFRYVAPDPRAVGMWAGSALRWVHNFDILHPTYLPAGQTRVYQRNATFGQWYVVNDGRWPGGWNVFADAGACAGQVIEYRVESKLAQIACVPAVRRVSVLPGTYEDDSPPGYLTLQFDGVAGG